MSKAEVLKTRTEVIDSISVYFDVRKLTDYQYRVNDTLDLFPVNCRYHDLQSKRRGYYPGKSLTQHDDLINFIDKRVEPK